MEKEKNFNAYTDWYDLWMKQSKNFFESANDHLENFFSDKEKYTHPEEHLRQIHAWLDILKKQWQSTPLSGEQKLYEKYIKIMNEMVMEASDRMVELWIKRSHTDHPIKSIHELYAVWLDCCHDIYTNAMRSQTFQEAYGDWMNATLKFWKAMNLK